MKKFPVLLFSLLLLFLISCSDKSSTSPLVPSDENEVVQNSEISVQTLEIEADKTLVTPSSSIVFSVKNLPEGFPDSKIIWYVDKTKKQTGGSSFTLTTASYNKRYSVYSVAQNKSNNVKSNTILCTSTDNKDLLDVIYQYIDSSNYTAGLSVSIFSPSNNIAFDFYDGKASVYRGKQNTESTKHIICSITKSFIAGAIVNLQLEGKINYTDTVSTYLSDYEIDENKINMNATIEQLLTHTSGIEDYIGIDMILDLMCYDKGILKLIPYDGKRHSYPYKDSWSPETLLNYATDNYSNVGTYKYASTNYILLGMIIEKITEQPLETYLKNLFLDNLNLDLKMAPRELTSQDYSNMASFHAYADYYSDFFNVSSSVLFALKLIGIDIPSKGLFDLSKSIPDIKMLMAQSTWAAGGYTGNAHQVTQWGYNLLSENGEVDSDIKSVIKASVSNKEYGYGIRKMTHDGFVFIGHYGEGAGCNHLMFYNSDFDICISILSDCSPGPDDNPEITKLLWSLFDKIKEGRL